MYTFYEQAFYVLIFGNKQYENVEFCSGLFIGGVWNLILPRTVKKMGMFNRDILLFKNVFSEKDD